MLSKYILIKKLLTLLGSVAVIGSTAAVAIACEGKTLGVVVKNAGTPEVKDQKQILSEESSDEGRQDSSTEKSAGSPSVGKNSEEEMKKELEEVEKAYKDAKKELRDANQKYQDALKEGKPYENKGNLPPTIADKIDKAEQALTLVNKKFTEIEKKWKRTKPN
ncbi:lipoprotein [Mycoplasma mycoides]|uniref:lipoprotein n=1 Tax=Mycoplasma mycoides TaxID=2102 RepID=UPI0034E44CCD